MIDTCPSWGNRRKVGQSVSHSLRACCPRMDGHGHWRSLVAAGREGERNPINHPHKLDKMMMHTSEHPSLQLIRLEPRFEGALNTRHLDSPELWLLRLRTLYFCSAFSFSSQLPGPTFLRQSDQDHNCELLYNFCEVMVSI